MNPSRPASFAAIVTPPPHAAEHRFVTPPCVLVVDDHEAVRVVQGMALRRAGFEVAFAPDGEEALSLIRDGGHRCDAVLLDMTLPGLSGIDTYHGIKALRPQVPVFLTTGHLAEDALSQFPAGALAGFLQKPFLLSELVQMVRGALGAPHAPG